MSKDSENQFCEHLHLVDNLYCDVLSEGKKYVCRSKKTAINTWKITCIGSASNFWETDLDYSDVVKHLKQKQSLGLEHNGFKNYFARCAEGFTSESISIHQQNKQTNLTIWCTYNDKQISYVFKLMGFSPEDSGDKLTKLMFDMVHLIYDLKHQNAFFESQNRALMHQRKEHDPDGLGPNSPQKKQHYNNYTTTTQVEAPIPVKRKAGFSLINPSSKRHVAKGAKIGESSPKGRAIEVMKQRG